MIAARGIAKRYGPLTAECLDVTADLRSLTGKERRTALAAAIEETGVGDVYFRPISQPSKGYRQRVGLAAAILHRPEILILDEPTERAVAVRRVRRHPCRAPSSIE